ncbi:MAG TPA: cytochrome P450 [Blastocatellia bacterium]|nr:cytochrome P450 [Blastocatellia bacterium]
MAMRAVPPGPRGHLIRGNLPEYVPSPLTFLEEVQRQYGDVARLRFFHIPIYIFNNPEHIEDVLVTKNRLFIKPVDFRFPFFRAIFGNGLLTSEGDFWLRQRRLAQPAFHRNRIAEYGRDMVSYSEKMLESWRATETRDIHREMMIVTLKIAIKALFNVDTKREAVIMYNLSDEVIKMFELQERSTWLAHNFLPTPDNRRFHKLVKDLDEYIYGIIRDRRRSGEDRGDLLSMLLDAQDEDDGSRMTDKQLRDEVMTLFMAGHETTALTLSWTWYLLSENPEADARLAAELESVLGGRAPRTEDLPQLKYANAIIKESMRLYPPAWGFGRQAIEDCEIGGYHIRKGRQLFFFPWIVHRDARYFENPEEFRPERWMDEKIKSLPKYAYFPFSGGPRACIGNSFAMMEAVLVLATVAQRFRLRLVEGHKIEPWPVFTLRPRHGVRMVIEKRETHAASRGAS